MQIVNQKIGAEGNIQVDLVNGVLNVVASENTPGCTVSVTAGIPLTYFVEAGAAKLNSPLLSSIAAILDGVLKTIA